MLSFLKRGAGSLNHGLEGCITKTLHNVFTALTSFRLRGLGMGAGWLSCMSPVEALGA